MSPHDSGLPSRGNRLHHDDGGVHCFDTIIFSIIIPVHPLSSMIGGLKISGTNHIEVLCDVFQNLCLDGLIVVALPWGMSSNIASLDSLLLDVMMTYTGLWIPE